MYVFWLIDWFISLTFARRHGQLEVLFNAVPSDTDEVAIGKILTSQSVNAAKLW